MATLNPDSSQAASEAARLRQAVSRLARRLRPRLQDAGISHAKLSVLGHLGRDGPLTPTELAAREGVKLQTLTRVFSELEAEGWLLRQASAEDARQSVLSLTRPGAKRLALAVRANENVLAEAIGHLMSASERNSLMQACALMDRIEESLRAQESLP